MPLGVSMQIAAGRIVLLLLLCPLCLGRTPNWKRKREEYQTPSGSVNATTIITVASDPASFAAVTVGQHRQTTQPMDNRAVPTAIDPPYDANTLSVEATTQVGVQTGPLVAQESAMANTVPEEAVKIDEALNVTEPAASESSSASFCSQELSKKSVSCYFVGNENMDMLRQALKDANTFNHLFSVAIKDSHFTRLASETFRDLDIVSLELEGNGCCPLPWSAISSLGAGLRRLSLSRNNVTLFEVPPDVELLFQDSLTLLNVSRSRIRSLKVGTFKRLANLSALSVSGNCIGHIEALTFTGLTQLMRLSVESSHVTTIDVAAFDGLTTLTVLDLTDNDLTTIPSGLFNELVSLTELRLAGNPFFCLPDLEWLKHWLKVNHFELSSGALCVHPPPAGLVADYDFKHD